MARTKESSKRNVGVAPSRKSADASKQSAEVKERKKHRFRPGTVALRKIKEYQKSTDNLIPKASINREIRRVAKDSCKDGNTVRFSEDAIKALQTACEQYLTDQFFDAQWLANSSKKVMVTKRNLRDAVLFNSTSSQERAAMMAQARDIKRKRREEKKQAAAAAAATAAALEVSEPEVELRA